MKLVFCPRCTDVFKLAYKIRSCECGHSRGKYLKDGLNARFYGKAIPLGFSNESLAKALKSRPEEGSGKRFTAFVIPKTCNTIKKKK